jgi:hypothetical protein
MKGVLFLTKTKINKGIVSRSLKEKSTAGNSWCQKMSVYLQTWRVAF